MKLHNLWIAWNDLYDKPYFVEEIINCKRFNTVEISFYFPIKDGKSGGMIEDVVSKLKHAGILTIAFMNAEFPASPLYNSQAIQRGDWSHYQFLEMLNPDGSVVTKGEDYGICQVLFDPIYRQYIENKINLLRSCGFDLISFGELGYSFSEKRNFTRESWNQFCQDIDFNAPSIDPSPEMEAIFINNPTLRLKYFEWKYNQLHSWLTGRVDGVGRQMKTLGKSWAPYLPDLTLVAPAFPGGKIVNSAEFGVGDADYVLAEQMRQRFYQPFAMKLGGIQFATGGGVRINDPTDMPNRIEYMLNNADGFTFYGSSNWEWFEDYLEYLPEIGQ